MEDNFKKIEGGILAEGEVSGHHHRVGVQVLERTDGVRIFEGATIVRHEEHNPIELVDNQWASDRVNETDHVSQMERKVVD